MKRQFSLCFLVSSVVFTTEKHNMLITTKVFEILPKDKRTKGWHTSLKILWHPSFWKISIYEVWYTCSLQQTPVTSRIHSCLKLMDLVNPLAPELNAPCSLQNPWSKLQDLILMFHVWTLCVVAGTIEMSTLCINISTPHTCSMGADRTSLQSVAIWYHGDATYYKSHSSRKFSPIKNYVNIDYRTELASTVHSRKKQSDVCMTIRPLLQSASSSYRQCFNELKL